MVQKVEEISKIEFLKHELLKKISKTVWNN
jgi:hypothetical protein